MYLIVYITYILIHDTIILTYHIKCVEMIEQLTYETYTYYIVFA